MNESQPSMSPDMPEYRLPLHQLEPLLDQYVELEAFALKSGDTEAVADARRHQAEILDTLGLDDDASRKMMEVVELRTADDDSALLSV